MGVRNFVRDRKQVKADRAETGSHAKLVAAMGGKTTAINHVQTIPAGSKPLTESNSDRYLGD
jgi:hypothetical protein